ncbi:hypothetical protein PENSUB_4059 [Penicillium subrubescens]|jgi:hypothetical protein|uniref:DUF4334 domain-containing protein n=2 Tax=Penicillium subrubescens TaxID=1316194 RepID=A0A1Q5UE52_9EURO|nr:hypothetical protein PENSUB_4059 [Penicillium subrubescens]
MALTTNPKILSPSHIDSVFCDLKPILPEKLIGEWDGFVLGTRHPFETELEKFNWFGHTFDSTKDVAPLFVFRNGRHVPYEDWGRASVSFLGGSIQENCMFEAWLMYSATQLHEIKYQGTVSAALIYDDHPVIVYYRAVRPDIVAGIMESKKFGRSGKFYFYLKRK